MDDLVEELKKMAVTPDGVVIGPQTLEDIIRELENNTPRGVRLRELDAVAREKTKKLVESKKRANQNGKDASK